MSAAGDRLDYLSVDDLLEIATALVEDLAVRDIGLLASAVGRPRVRAFGEDAYPTFPSKAAALMHSLARNHPLVDGNKRLAWSATRIFCLLNGRDLVHTADEAEAVVVAVATGDLDVPQLAEWIDERLR